MSDLLKAQLAGLIRAAILAFGVFLVKHHVDNSDAAALTAMIDPTAIAGFLMSAGAIAWSMIHKNSVNTSLVVAAATGKTTATMTTGAALAATAAMPNPPSEIPTKPL